MFSVSLLGHLTTSAPFASSQDLILSRASFPDAGKLRNPQTCCWCEKSLLRAAPVPSSCWPHVPAACPASSLVLVGLHDEPRQSTAWKKRFWIFRSIFDCPLSSLWQTDVSPGQGWEANNRGPRQGTTAPFSDTGWIVHAPYQSHGNSSHWTNPAAITTTHAVHLQCTMRQQVFLPCVLEQTCNVWCCWGGAQPQHTSWDTRLARGELRHGNVASPSWEVNLIYQSQSTGFFSLEGFLFIFIVCFNSVVFEHLPIILTFIWLALQKKVLYITIDLQIIIGITQTEGKVCAFSVWCCCHFVCNMLSLVTWCHVAIQLLNYKLIWSI